MVTDVVRNISKESSTDEIQAAFEHFSAIVPQSLSEYIILQYNKCLLYQWSKKERDFLSALRELNRLTNSRLIDDGEVGELLFYNIAQFNYQIHNYIAAKKGFEKSIKQEYLDELTKDNVEFRIEKRLLLCLCDEYIAIESQNVLARKKTLRSVISLLAGIDIETRLDEEERAFVGKKLVSLAENPNQSVQSILDGLIPDGQSSQNAPSDQNDFGVLQPSVLQFIRNAKTKRWIDDECYSKWLNELVHILAHCLSERWQIEQLPNEHQGLQTIEFQRMYYYKRLADILMNKLGDKYVTCYAILKIENHEFFSAYNCLNTARARAVEKCNIENRKLEEDSFIAEIDFYCWYFAVYADHFRYGLFHKEAFKKYCDTMGEKDPVAEIYYHVMNMKELLVIGFDKLSRLRCDEQYKEKIDVAFEDFIKHRPSYSIHKEIKKEWGFLYRSYYIYKTCFDITKHFSDEQKTLISMYKLSKQLLKEKTVSIYSGNRWEAIKNPKFFIVTTSFGKFFYKGSIDYLIEVCPSMSIQITNILCAEMDKLSEKLDSAHNTYTSNVLILANNQSIEADIQFAEAIIQFDETKPINDKHNIYIDLSQLSVINKDKINAIYEEYSSEQRSIDLITNKKTSILMCSLFSAIEDHLMRLKKKLVSNVISPVVQDEPFEFQYRDKLLLMSLKEIGYKLGSIPNWNAFFGSCYTHEETNKFHALYLNCIKLREMLEDDYSKIDYIFNFKSNKEKKDRVALIAFSLNRRSVIQDNTVCGDIITIQDSTKSWPDIIIAIRQLYNDNKRDAQNIHQQNCDKNCFSSFTNADIEHINYRSLREYLYSYLGVLLEKRKFLLIQNENGQNTSYIICAFKKNEHDPLTERRVCHALRKTTDYILTDSPDSSGHTETEEKVFKELKMQLEKLGQIPSEKKFIFISYRSQNGTPRLCIPVYRDFMYFYKRYTNIEWKIDVRSFDCNLGSNITSSITDENCIGSFVYLSEEYLSGDDLEDYCLKELEMLADKKKNNPSFFVIPVFLYDKGDPIQGLIVPIKDKNNHMKGTPSSKSREKSLDAILSLQPGMKSDTFFLQWDNNDAHLKKLEFLNNFNNSLNNALNHNS